MGALNPKQINNPIERYQNLKLKDSLSKPYQFSLACKELSFILRNAYSKSPKYLQSLIFEETLFAFSLLPKVETQSSIAAAYSLLQSAEFALQKQKRGLAVKEYKQALVTYKRKPKSNQDEKASTFRPQDVLVYIFGFLDLQSLVSASAVCWSWNAAARDNHLWKNLYNIFFCSSKKVSKQIGLKNCGLSEKKEKKIQVHSRNGIDIDNVIEWRQAFGTAYAEIYSKRSKSQRGYCWTCGSIVWLTNKNCSNNSCTEDNSHHQIKSISTQQIVEYILDGVLSSESSSDSDSGDDNEDVAAFKLWAYPRQNN